MLLRIINHHFEMRKYLHSKRNFLLGVQNILIIILKALDQNHVFQVEITRWLVWG